MKNLLIVFFLITPVFSACGQGKNNFHIDENYYKVIDRYLSYSIPLVSVEEVKKGRYMLLDTRKEEEYRVSHIPNARYVGEKCDDMDMSSLKGVNKADTIVVYCSIGYRSEKVGEVLKGKGYKNVFNLAGGVFEWVNKGFSLKKGDGVSTTKVHVYSESWGKWVNCPIADKVY